MTVQELINKLQEIPDRSIPVKVEDTYLISEDTGYGYCYKSIINIKDLETWVCLYIKDD